MSPVRERSVDRQSAVVDLLEAQSRRGSCDSSRNTEPGSSFRLLAPAPAVPKE